MDKKEISSGSDLSDSPWTSGEHLEEAYIKDQKVEATTGRVCTFVTKNESGDLAAISPLFDCKDDLLKWLGDKGWVLDEFEGDAWRCTIVDGRIRPTALLARWAHIQKTELEKARRQGLLFTYGDSGSSDVAPHEPNHPFAYSSGAAAYSGKNDAERADAGPSDLSDCKGNDADSETRIVASPDTEIKRLPAGRVIIMCPTCAQNVNAAIVPGMILATCPSCKTPVICSTGKNTGSDHRIAGWQLLVLSVTATALIAFSMVFFVPTLQNWPRPALIIIIAIPSVFIGVAVFCAGEWLLEKMLNMIGVKKPRS